MGTSDVNRNSLLGKENVNKKPIKPRGFVFIPFFFSKHWPKEDWLVFERQSFSVSDFFPARCGKSVVAQTSLNRYWDYRGRVLAAASMLGEAAGDLRGRCFLWGNTEGCGTKHQQQLLVESEVHDKGRLCEWPVLPSWAGGEKNSTSVARLVKKSFKKNSASFKQTNNH